MSDQPSGAPESPRPSPPVRERQSSGDLAREAAPGPPEHSSSPESVQLLSQILQRLQRMEGGLSQHEQWLRRIEDEQKQPEPSATAAPISAAAPPDDQLQRLVGSLTLERDRAEKELAEAQRQLGVYQHELSQLRKQVGDFEKRLAERERDLTGLKTTAAQGLEQARTLQSEAQRQLQSREQRIREIESAQTAAQRQLAVRERQIAEMQSALDNAAVRFERISRDLAAQSEEDAASVLTERAWSRFARFAVVAAFASAIASVGLTGWLYARGQEVRLQRVSTTVLLPGVGEEGFKACIARAGRDPQIEASGDPGKGTIELSIESEDAQAALARIERLAGELVASITPAAESAASRPAETDEIKAARERIAHVDRQLADTTAGHLPELPDLDVAELTTRSQTIRDERARLRQQLAELESQTQSKQAQSAPADVTTEEIARAESQNQSLQAEAEALQQRQQQLAGRLQVSIDTAGVKFQSLQKSLTEADGQLQKLLEDNQPDEVKTQLTTVRESLKTWAQATTELDAAWKRQRGLLNNPASADTLGIQAELEKSARTFMDQVTAANNKYAGAIAAIGQGQDQTTKRLVLRNALVKQLEPVAAEQSSAIGAARAVILNDDLELTAIVQRLDALSKQVHQRRGQIAAFLRQERLSQAQKDRTTHLSRIRQQEQEITRQLDGLEAELLKLGEQATTAVAASVGAQTRMASRMALLTALAADLRQVVEAHEQFAASVAGRPALPKPAYLPPRVLASSRKPPSRISAALLGSTPALACAAGLATFWLVTSSRRSRQTIEDYARTLKETARQASLGEQERAEATSESQAG